MAPYLSYVAFRNASILWKICVKLLDPFWRRALSVGVENAKEFDTFESETGTCHVRPLGSVVRQDGSWLLEVRVVHVKRKFGRELVTADRLAWAASLTGSKIEETNLIPQGPACMCFKGTDSVFFRVTMEAYTLSQTNCRPNES